MVIRREIYSKESGTGTGLDSPNPSNHYGNVSGTIVGLNGIDWDSAYDRVSGVVRFGDVIR